ncbi:MAG: hypothetical protein KAY96_03240 [Bacteroidia bacterium]|nr:hypothetical protein [Bacteroidota bacterium]MBP6641209.1 hypothetical protein [Bacteroidia bacterium]MBP8073750.1 hypothetical protein [Bacteroidia bacterium]
MNTSPTFDTLKLNLIQHILKSDNSAILAQMSDLIPKDIASPQEPMKGELLTMAYPERMNHLRVDPPSRQQPRSFEDYVIDGPMPQSGKFGHDFP